MNSVVQWSKESGVSGAEPEFERRQRGNCGLRLLLGDTCKAFVQVVLF